jgi:hypothetical protein
LVREVLEPLIQAVQEVIPYFQQLHQRAVVVAASLGRLVQTVGRVAAVPVQTVPHLKLEVQVIHLLQPLRKVTMVELGLHQQPAMIEMLVAVEEPLRLAQLLLYLLVVTEALAQHHQLPELL